MNALQNFEMSEQSLKILHCPNFWIVILKIKYWFAFYADLRMNLIHNEYLVVVNVMGGGGLRYFPGGGNN